MFGVWQVSNKMTSAEPLTAEQATSKVKELYSGQIVEVKEGENLYLITIQLETGTYDIEIDRHSGDIGKLTQTTTDLVSNEKVKKEPHDDSSSTLPNDSSVEKPKEKDPSGESESKQEKKDSTAAEKPKLLTEKEAIAIALKELNGEVDDVELESQGGITYYLVDIEREDNEDEATIQINAVSGEIMSIVWDD
nr:PepSY domain-containing protein [Cytobacillus eiseniae]